MKRYLFTILSTVALALGLFVSPVSQQATAASSDGKFAIVVHDANGFSGSRGEMINTVRQVFLKERSAWPGGDDARPFGAGADSDEHKAFLATVLKMSQAELAQHWIALKQRTGQTPPREVGNTKILGKFVGKYEGALGVMTVEDAKGVKGVKILFEFD